MTTATFADRLAELLADPTFEPELLAESQRSTEIPWWFGQLRTDVAYARPQKMSVSAYRGFNPIGRNIQKALPVRPCEYRCAAYGSLVKHGQTGDGTYFKKPLNCGKCVRCQEWRVQLKAHRFTLLDGPPHDDPRQRVCRPRCGAQVAHKPGAAGRRAACGAAGAQCAVHVGCGDDLCPIL